MYSKTVPGGRETPVPGPEASVEVTMRSLIPVPVAVTLVMGVDPPTFTEILPGGSGAAGVAVAEITGDGLLSPDPS
jgi:hypothetical protein